MADNLQITELELPDGSGHHLKITGASNETEAFEAARTWADENNCLVTAINPNKDGKHFVAMVCSDDYK